MSWGHFGVSEGCESGRLGSRKKKLSRTLAPLVMVWVGPVWPRYEEVIVALVGIMDPYLRFSGMFPRAILAHSWSGRTPQQTVTLKDPFLVWRGNRFRSFHHGVNMRSKERVFDKFIDYIFLDIFR